MLQISLSAWIAGGVCIFDSAAHEWQHRKSKLEYLANARCERRRADGRQAQRGIQVVGVYFHSAKRREADCRFQPTGVSFQ